MKTKKNDVNYSAVTRYGMVTKHWYEESYKEIGECSYGGYVLFSDYEKLLKDKVPPRLPADFTAIAKIIEKQAASLEKSAEETFEKKDKMNYQWAIGQQEKAYEYLRVLNDLEKFMHINE